MVSIDSRVLSIATKRKANTKMPSQLRQGKMVLGKKINQSKKKKKSQRKAERKLHRYGRIRSKYMTIKTNMRELT